MPSGQIVRFVYTQRTHCSKNKTWAQSVGHVEVWILSGEVACKHTLGIFYLGLWLITADTNFLTAVKWFWRYRYVIMLCK